MKEIAAVPLVSLQLPTTEETHPARPASGMRGLMLAVLDDAMHSLSSSESLVRVAAEQWMMSPERRYAFSFVVICETLDLEPSAVRRSVINLLDKKGRRGRLLKRSRPNVRHRGQIQPSRARHHSPDREGRPRRFPH
jgi:hypothetical protein